jgi:glycosyltransferase involved in cell wall biosynthesis
MPVEISVVIPAFNEERCLSRLLDDIAEARRRYRLGSENIEVIIADNGSTDGTVSIAVAHGCTVAPVTKRVIAAVRNGGARAARGNFVSFVDADTQLHPETFNAIDDYFADGTRILGVSGALPERRSLGIDVTWGILGSLTVLLGYGIPRTRSELAPTGLVCCRRADWEKVGGYSERLRFGEDVWFLLALKRLGRRKKQSVGWLKGVPAVFSTRKFDDHGDWHLLGFALRIMLGILWYPTLARWVDGYWYGPQRQTTPAEKSP